MLALDVLGDVVDEHARDQRGDRGHQENPAEDDAEPGRDRDDPGKDVERRVEARPQHRLGPDFADSANQLNARCSPMASTATSTSANPIERHRMVRIGGDRICEIALTAASNMAVLPLVKKPSREVDTPKGFDKGFDKRLPAPGKQDCRQKQEVAMTRVQELYPDSQIVLREVGLRDGLQLVKTFPSTEAKQRWMRDEYAAGVRHFEVGSFLPAKTFPQFADVREMIQTVASLPGPTALR